jgi:hypothetical protein
MKFTKDTQGCQFSKSLKRKRKNSMQQSGAEMRSRVQVLDRLEGKVKYIEQLMNDTSSTILF